MIKFRESRVRAHHNYLVNAMLTPGFLVGNREAQKGFYFLAAPLSPDENDPRVYGRIMDEKGILLAELKGNGIGENPGGCVTQPVPGGFRIADPSGGSLLEIRTQQFPYGLLTRIKTKLFDEEGVLRVEPLGDSIQVHGESILVLDEPMGSDIG